jgi:hypothetical protein
MSMKSNIILIANDKIMDHDSLARESRVHCLIGFGCHAFLTLSLSNTLLNYSSFDSGEEEESFTCWDVRHCKDSK